MEWWFDFFKPFASEEQELNGFSIEKDGQMKIKMDKKMIVKKRKKRMEIEHSQVEPNGEHIRWEDDPLQKDTTEG